MKYYSISTACLKVTLHADFQTAEATNFSLSILFFLFKSDFNMDS